MGNNTFIGLLYLSNNYDWFIRINWVESNSYFLKFYSFDANTKYGNEYSCDSEIFTIKKEFPNYSKEEVILKASKKMMLPILYTVLTTICAFLSLIFSGIKPIIDFGWMMTLGLVVSLIVTFLLLPALINVFSNENEIEVKILKNLLLHQFLGHLQKKLHNNFLA